MRNYLLCSGIWALPLLAVFVGCYVPSTKQYSRQVQATAQQKAAEEQPALSVFQGKRDKPITWDLWGDWQVNKVKTPESRGTSGRWEESWHPRQRTDKTHLIWTDPLRGETFTLFHTAQGDMLRWRRYRGRIFDFSVNKQSYGLLLLTDQNGQTYQAIRSEGGEE